MKLIVAGGGTGGHLYPGLAVADEVRRRGGDVLFVGTERGIEATAVPAAGYPLETLQVSGLKRMGLAGTVRGLGRLPRAFWQSRRILQRFAPDCVLGVGGYASGPLVLMAALAGVPTALQEQNSVPGFTNRTLGRVARRVFLGFPEAARAFPDHKCLHTGNPVRSMFLDRAEAASGHATRRGGLLVVGGSQGARAVNDLMVAALTDLAARGVRPPVLHQTGKADAERVRAAYVAAGLGDHVEAQPFIDDMASAYAAADLVIGRAGALTLAELAIAGRASILIPLPTAADDHQTRNAQAFAAAGAALVCRQPDATGHGLAQTISELLSDSARLSAMGRASSTLARPDAARQIADALAQLTSA